MRTKRRWLVKLAIVGLVLVALFVLVALPGRSRYTVSPETTYITEPLGPTGHLDYVAALNDRLAGGVETDKNAYVLVLQALGPKPEGVELPEEHYRRLGIARLPAEGDYYRSSGKFIDEMKPDADAKKEWGKRFFECAKRPWSAADEPKVAEWLAVNEKPLAMVIEASQRPQWYFPLTTTKTDPRDVRVSFMPLHAVQKCRDVVNALAARAMLRTREKRYDLAWQDLAACHRLGMHVAGGGTSIEVLVGVAQATVAHNALMHLVAAADHSPERLREWRADAAKWPRVPPLAGKFDLAERFASLEVLQAAGLSGQHLLTDYSTGPATPPPPKGTSASLGWFSRSIDYDPAMRRTNEVMDRMAAACRLPDRPAREAAWALIEEELSDAKVAGRGSAGWLASPGTRGRAVNEILLRLMVSTRKKTVDVADRAEQTFRNRDIALALALHRAENGRYPAKLEDLSPKYFAKVPTDVFTEKSPMYVVLGRGYLLYSVGVNGRDEEGRWVDDDPPGDDPRVRMPIPKPAPPVPKKRELPDID